MINAVDARNKSGQDDANTTSAATLLGDKKDGAGEVGSTCVMHTVYKVNHLS